LKCRRAAQVHGASPDRALPPEDPFCPCAEALTFLAEGVDASVSERAWQLGEGTLRTWLTRAGLHAEKVHEHFFQQLWFDIFKLDELWANIRQQSQDVWVWVRWKPRPKIGR